MDPPHSLYLTTLFRMAREFEKFFRFFSAGPLCHAQASRLRLLDTGLSTGETHRIDRTPATWGG